MTNKNNIGLALITKVKYIRTLEKEIDGLLIYMGSQVTRRNSSFYDDEILLAGNEKSNKRVINDIKNFKGFIDYMGAREGSTGLFTTYNRNINREISKALKHQGHFNTIIFSMKESDARYYVIDENQFTKATRKAMNELSKYIKVSNDNLSYVAAFHLKTTKDAEGTNRGKQPHVHVLMWDQSNGRRKYKFSEYELKMLKKLIFRNLFNQYHKGFYEERNKLRGNFQRDFIEELEQNDNCKLILKSIKQRLFDLFDNEGFLNYARIDREYKNLVKQRYEGYIVNYYSTLDHEYEYKNLISEINQIINIILKSPKVRDDYQKWSKVSDEMRKYQGAAAAAISRKEDFVKILNILKNQILRETRSATEIKPDNELKGLLLEYLKNSNFIARKECRPSLKYKDTDEDIKHELLLTFIRIFAKDYDLNQYSNKSFFSFYTQLCWSFGIDNHSVYFNEAIELWRSCGYKDEKITIDDVKFIDKYLQLVNVDHLFNRAPSPYNLSNETKWSKKESQLFHYEYSLRSSKLEHFIEDFENEYYEELLENRSKNKLHKIDVKKTSIDLLDQLDEEIQKKVELTKEKQNDNSKKLKMMNNEEIKIDNINNKNLENQYEHLLEDIEDNEEDYEIIDDYDIEL